MAVLTVLAAVLGSASTASANCNTLNPTAVSGRDGPGQIKGTRSVIHINDFNEAQCDTTRSIFAIGSPNDRVELGWFKTLGDPAEVLYTRTKDGIFYPTYNTGITPAAGSDKTFAIENGDGDHNWGVFFEGNRIDGLNVNFTRADAFITQSEKEYSGGSLLGHWFNLRECFDPGCNNYQNPSNFHRRGDTAGSWVWCKIDEAEHFVKGSC